MCKLFQKCSLAAKVPAQLCTGLIVQILCKLHSPFCAIKSHESSLAILAVAADGLAQLFRSAGNIQHIVHDLKNQSQTVRVVLQRPVLSVDFNPSSI